MDDIPIRPSKEYLEQAVSQAKPAKSCTDYLRKSKPRYLPSATAAQIARKPPSPKKPSPSKKEIYERIKTHNDLLKAKYRSDEPIIPAKPSNTGLARPSQGLNSEKQPKPSEHKPKREECSMQTQKVIAQRSSTKAEDYKQKYENMLKQLNQEKAAMERERKELEEQKEYLEFKKQLKNVQGLREAKPLRANQQQQAPAKRTQSSRPASSKVTRDVKKNPPGQTTTKRSPKKESPKSSEKFKKEMEESKRLIETLNKRVQQLSMNTLKKTKNIQELLEEAEYDYTLADLPKLQTFSLADVNRLISLKEFRHTTNPYYHEYEAHYQDYKVVKHLKQGAKSIKQFSNGCKEMEVQRKYRLLEWPQNQYKLTLFANGDVKQELAGPLVMYFSKSKQLNRINYQLSSELYYFYELGQLELHTKVDGATDKRIRYRDGTISHIPAK